MRPHRPRPTRPHGSETWSSIARLFGEADWPPTLNRAAASPRSSRLTSLSWFTASWPAPSGAQHAGVPARQVRLARWLSRILGSVLDNRRRTVGLAAPPAVRTDSRLALRGCRTQALALPVRSERSAEIYTGCAG